jgi:hypothetical protein
MPVKSASLETQGFTNVLRFEVLTAVTMKMAVFWVVAPRSLVHVYLE